MDKNNLAYHITGVMMIQGPLNIEKVNTILDKLVQRHQMLRAGFETKNGIPVINIHNKVKLKVTYKKGSEDIIDDYIKEFIAPFNLSVPPLARILIGEIDQEKFFLAIDFHHIISDGITMGIFIQEFIQLYEGKNLRDIDKEYTDYIELEKNYLSKDNYKFHKEFWRKKLATPLPILPMNTDFPRTPKNTFQGKRKYFSISQDDTSKLKELAKTTKQAYLQLCFHYLMF